MSKDAILAGLLAENKAKCVPPLPDEEVQRIAQSVSKYEPAPKTTEKGRKAEDVKGEVREASFVNCSGTASCYEDDHPVS